MPVSPRGIISCPDAGLVHFTSRSRGRRMSQACQTWDKEFDYAERISPSDIARRVHNYDGRRQETHSRGADGNQTGASNREMNAGDDQSVRISTGVVCCTVVIYAHISYSQCLLGVESSTPSAGYSSPRRPCRLKYARGQPARSNLSRKQRKQGAGYRDNITSSHRHEIHAQSRPRGRTHERPTLTPPTPLAPTSQPRAARSSSPAHTTLP